MDSNALNMKRDFDTVRKTVDECLINALTDNNACGIISFSCFLDKVLSRFNIGIASFEREGRLSVYGDEAFTIIHAIYYYLLDLEKNDYLLYVDLTTEFDSLDYGKTCQNSSGKLSKILSSFIWKHSRENAYISPLIKDYIKNNHCSPELHEARGQRRIAIISVIFSGIAVLFTAISTALAIGNVIFPQNCYINNLLLILVLILASSLNGPVVLFFMMLINHLQKHKV